MILSHTLILNVTSLGLESAPDNGACDDSKGQQKSPLLLVVYILSLCAIATTAALFIVHIHRRSAVTSNEHTVSVRMITGNTTSSTLKSGEDADEADTTSALERGLPCDTPSQAIGGEPGGGELDGTWLPWFLGTVSEGLASVAYGIPGVPAPVRRPFLHSVDTSV
ncbi:hypothetical protein GY45DRAFT_933056 [Cubamyces sp. BRFM 1775]|nr:hypothetical protein GY45DRAFT_933056 [Cubamyces sp. BRFM 1775]